MSQDTIAMLLKGLVILSDGKYATGARFHAMCCEIINKSQVINTDQIEALCTLNVTFLFKYHTENLSSELCLAWDSADTCVDHEQ